MAGSATTPSFMLSSIALMEARGVLRSWETAEISSLRACSSSRSLPKLLLSWSDIVLKAEASSPTSSLVSTDTWASSLPALMLRAPCMRSCMERVVGSERA